MKRLCKMLVLLLALESMVIGGHAEVEPDRTENQLGMHYVGFGTSVGKNVFVPVGSQAVFGCAFDGDEAIQSVQWKLYEHAGCSENIASSTYNIQFFGNLDSTFDRKIPEECFTFYEGRFSPVNPSTKVSSIIRVNDVITSDERSVSCEFFAENFHASGQIRFKLKVFSLPTVFVENPRIDGFDKRLIVCSMKKIYPEPDNDSIRLYSTKTNKELDADNAMLKTAQNSDGSFDINKYFVFPVDMSHHNESYYCIVEMLIGNTTFIRSQNSTSPIMIEHPTINVKLSFNPNPVKDGEETQVTCESDGYPVENIIIYQLKAFHQYATWNGSDSNRLQINFIANKSMEGNYICQANNVIMTEYLTIEWSADDIKLWRNGEIYINDEDINISEGDNLTLSCTQGGFPQPRITWDVTMDGISYTTFDNWEDGVVITNAKIENSGIYRCSSSVGLKRGIKVIVGACKPQITISGTKFDNGSVSINVTCSKQYNNPKSPCNLKLGTEYDVTSGSVQKNEMNSISKIFHLSGVDESKHFWCRTLTSKGFELCTVYNSVECDLTTIHTTNKSNQIGIIVMIFVGLFIIGFITHLLKFSFSPCSCHFSCNRDGEENEQTDEPISDAIELEPMNPTKQVPDGSLHGEEETK